MSPEIVPKSGNRPLWKVTFRIGSRASVVLAGKWHEEVRVYRWRWRARLAAFLHRIPGPAWIVAWANVERYWPHQDNVVDIRKRA